MLHGPRWECLPTITTATTMRTIMARGISTVTAMVTATGTASGHGGHSHGPLTLDRAFAIGITLNILFVIVKFGPASSRNRSR